MAAKKPKYVITVPITVDGVAKQPGESCDGIPEEVVETMVKFGQAAAAGSTESTPADDK